MHSTLHEYEAGHAGGTGDPSPTAGMAGGKSVHGADVVVFALTRSVRNIVPIVENGTGDPSPTVMYDDAPMYR